LRAIHAEDPTLSSQIELYVDGGVRRGSDVLQALAFGARGVGLGRPFLYAQAAYGEEGVIRAVRSESLGLLYVDDAYDSHGRRDCDRNAFARCHAVGSGHASDGRVLAGSLEMTSHAYARR